LHCFFSFCAKASGGRGLRWLLCALLGLYGLYGLYGFGQDRSGAWPLAPRYVSGRTRPPYSVYVLSGAVHVTGRVFAELKSSAGYSTGYAGICKRQDEDSWPEVTMVSLVCDMGLHCSIWAYSI
jgi:hypothetical protein